MQAIRLGASIWEPSAHQLRRDGGVLPLTPLEARLLGYLAERAGRTVSSDELLRDVWEYSTRAQTRAVANTVARLRTKLGDDASAIVTVYGRGYRLEPRGDDDMVGRDALLEHVRQTLQSTRWVTLFGLGGVGKTRVARALAEIESRRTLWVPCGALRTEAELWAALAHMLDLAATAAPEVVQQALDALGATCLVLDAVENLGATSADVAATLRANCPQLHLIVTSRVHHGEGAAVRVPRLDHESATALFLRRAREVQGSTREHEPQAVRTVVEQVDGIPLGIELAAGRLRLFDLPALAEQMRADPHIVDRVGNSIEAVLEQSWQSLGPDEQAAWQAAAQFPEGCRLEQVGAVSGLPQRRLLDALEGLVRASLLLDRHPRFRMLDLVRSFGAGKAEDDHRRAFEACCVEAATELWEGWLEGRPVRRDTPGYLVAAFGPILDRRGASKTDRARLALGMFAHQSRYGSITHRRDLFRDLEVEGLAPRLTACVRLVQAWSAYLAAEWEEATTRAHEGRVAAEAAADVALRLRCWRMAVGAPLAIGVLDDGLATEVANLEQVATTTTTTGAELAQARALHVCGIYRACVGQLREAAALYQRALALAEDDLGLRLGITAHMAYAYRQLERLDLALEVLEEAWNRAIEEGLGSASLAVGNEYAAALAAAQRYKQADALHASLAERGLQWGDRSTAVGAIAWKAMRQPDPLRREGALVRVAARATRDQCPEVAGHCDLLRAHSLHTRNELDLAQAAYDASLAHLAPFGQLFSVTLARAWRALLQLERGTTDAVEIPLLDKPAPLEATVISLVTAAATGDWARVDEVAAAAVDDAVIKTIELASRLRRDPSG